MDSASEHFDLHATLASVGQALMAVFCHMLFMFSVHGLAMAAAIAVVAYVLKKRNHRFGLPLVKVAKRAAIFCIALALPGAYCLLVYGKLPDAGVFNFNSIGFFCLWSLIYLHLSAEEIYHRESRV